ncbi:phosphatidate cytidylyltransferase [Paenibacillus abyssi]|uniref:Phosphatidate cytidylyltransferase n=1 Tax=Paenibacillus abyssi TaxID=1340531 RepID=A0A917D688_9BACL|nr:phosphatidate cytidylyltransferase [Paenibacillus abyssi]GGG12121.1 phosphatidate cytidylyltransferase [Paenibacillus abyssi]
MKQRIITGIIAGSGFIGMAILGGWPYIGMLLLLSLIGYAEFVRMNSLKWHQPAALLGFAGLLFLVFPWSELQLTRPSSELILWMLMFLLLSITVLSKNKITIDHAASLLIGAVYIGFGFSAMMTVRALDPYGLLSTFLAFGCIWASDIGAYFSGRAFGKNKLWPSISPNKTVEGAIGGVLLSLVVALAFALLTPDWIGLGQALIIGVVCAVAGQLGDLIQSAYKRVRGIKDTGTLLPGHGGVLDRCDSWLIVFPILTLTGLL